MLLEVTELRDMILVESRRSIDAVDKNDIRSET